jgi:hypothetical protein
MRRVVVPVGATVVLVILIASIVVRLRSDEPASSVGAQGATGGAPTSGSTPGSASTGCDPEQAVSFDLKYDPAGLKWYASEEPLPQSLLPYLVRYQQNLDVESALKAAGLSNLVTVHFYGGTKLKLVATGHCSSEVLLTNMRAVVTRRDRPPSGGVIVLPPQGAPEDSPVLGVNLDQLADNSVYPYNPMSGLGKQPYFDSKQIPLANEESQAFEIHGLTNQYYAEWHLVVDAQINGVSKTYPVDLAGTPIRSTAPADDYDTAYAYIPTPDTTVYWREYSGKDAAQMLKKAPQLDSGH